MSNFETPEGGTSAGRTSSPPSSSDWPRFYGQLHRFVAARVRGAADVDDLVQAILARAVEKVTQAEVDNVAGWLFGIARNAIADHYRGQARVLIDAAAALESAPAPLGGSDQERAEVIACMEPLLKMLSDDDAQLLRWADMEDRSMQAIADELGISLTAAKSRVQRARSGFIKVARECCSITRDARGRVTELTPRSVPKALECAASCGGCDDAQGRVTTQPLA